MSSLFYFFRVRSVYFLMEKFHKIFFLYVSFLLLTTLLRWNEIIFSVCFCYVLLPMSPRCPISCSSSSSPSHRMKGFALSQPFPTSVCSLSVSRLPLFFLIIKRPRRVCFYDFLCSYFLFLFHFHRCFCCFPYFMIHLTASRKNREQDESFHFLKLCNCPSRSFVSLYDSFSSFFSAHLNLVQF